MSSMQQALSSRVASARDHYRRESSPGGDQRLVQLHSAHFREVYVQDEAGIGAWNIEPEDLSRG